MEEEIAGALGEVRVVGITAIATVAAAMLGVMGVEMAMPAGTEVEMAAETIADKGGQERTVIFTRSVPTLTSTVWERMEIR